MQSGQQGQPVQPVQPGQSVQPVQLVYVQSPPGQLVQSQQQDERGICLTIDTNFLKSPLCYIKIAEFVVLLGAWASILKFTLEDVGDYNRYTMSMGVDFFKGIPFFCWVIVSLYLIIHTFSVPKILNCKRPFMFPLMSLILYFIMFAFLLAFTGNLVHVTVVWGKFFKLEGSGYRYREEAKPYWAVVSSLCVASAFGFLSCIAFVVDMVLNYKLFQTQRAQETTSDQGLRQRRALDVNTKYLRSPIFYVKLAEIAFLLGSWACIVKYFDLDIMKRLFIYPRDELDSKANFFQNITIFSWVMVILSALTSVLSFDKLCSRSSLWTLTTMIIYLILSILLIACCGNLTPRAAEWGKEYKSLSEKSDFNLYSSRTSDVFLSKKSNVLGLLVGLGFGYSSCIAFVVDMVLSYNLFRTQRAQETFSDQRPRQRRAGDVNTKYLRSAVFYVKLAEIALLFGAWVCILKYFFMNLFTKLMVKDLKGDVFKGITIFSWAMATVLTLTSVLSFDKLFRRSSRWTLTTMIIYFILSTLLIACCGNLTPRAVDWAKAYKTSFPETKPNILALLTGLAFGFLSYIAFIVDMVLTYKLFQTQRAQETSPEQGPPQRQAGDVNNKYLRSPVFYVKVAEFALLFGAWVCIVNYFDLDHFMYLRGGLTRNWPPAVVDSKADFFKGIAIFSWVTVSLLALTFVLSFDKICRRSSRWTLTTLMIHFILFILLISCCGNLTPRAVDFGRRKLWSTSVKHKVLALLTGLALGYISCVIIIVDICLLYKLYRQQKAEEASLPQRASQPLLVQQPAAVVILPQSAKHLFYQTDAHLGQQLVQHPAQHTYV